MYLSVVTGDRSPADIAQSLNDGIPVAAELMTSTGKACREQPNIFWLCTNRDRGNMGLSRGRRPSVPIEALNLYAMLASARQSEIGGMDDLAAFVASTSSSRAAHDAQSGSAAGRTDTSHDHPEPAHRKQPDTPRRPPKKSAPSGQET